MGLTIMAAVEADNDDIFIWRNDPISIKQSFTMAPVDKEQHDKWFNEKLKNELCNFYIGYDESGSNKIGVVRLELKSDNVCEVAINMNPHWRSKGLGSSFLNDVLAMFDKSYSVSYVANIKPENIASRRCFEKAGFSIYEANEKKIIYVNKQALIDKIELVRSKNNVNWMNLMRLAFKTSPQEAEEIFLNINKEDNEISNLLAKLSQKITSYE